MKTKFTQHRDQRHAPNSVATRVRTHQIKNFRSKHASIAKARWAAYAAAGAATALAGTNSAEADIHYSGILNLSFRPHRDGTHRLPLDQSGDFLVFQRDEVGTAFFQRTDIDYFRINGIASAAFRGTGTYGGYNFYVSKLHSGQNVSSGYFPHTFHSRFNYGGIMAHGPYPGSSPWRDRGTGYVGFKFNNGAGIQYGWVRVRMSGPPENAFKVVSYAYADPGEPITAGQTSSNEKAPDEGSLGWLAAGAVGLLAWRKSRSRKHATNFRDDVTIDGRINNQDVQTARSHRGESLP